MATEIHPNACVEPGAQLGNNVKVGAFSFVGAEVKLGDDCVLHNNVSISGKTTVGAGNEFYPHSAIGGRSQDLKYTEEPTYLTVGDRNVFRESVTVNRGTEPNGYTKIGDDNNFLAYSHIAHDCIVGSHCIFSNNGTLAGHIIVENYVILGGLTAVHQFCRLGAHCITGGCSKIVQDVVPFTIVDGNPAETRGVNKVGLERRGFTSEQIKEIREAYQVTFRDGLNTKQALEKLSNLEGDISKKILQFIESSDRGIVK